MKGYPKTLHTREDYEYVRINFPKSQWEKDFQFLLDSLYEWFFVKELLDGEEGIVDDTHKVEVQEADEEQGIEKTTRYQFEWRLNPNCKLIELGYTVEQVQQYLQS